MEYLLDRALLPDNKALRRKLLDEYFSLDLIGFEELLGNEWKLTTFSPDKSEYFVDPQLDEVLANWIENISINELSLYKRFYKNCMFSFVDSWSLYFWSLYLTFSQTDNSKFTLFHVDDHKDHDTPLIYKKQGKYFSILSQNEINLLNPTSIANAITEKSITMGSFISLLIHHLQDIDVLHLRYSSKKGLSSYKLETSFSEDDLLLPGEQRPSISLFTKSFHENLFYSDYSCKYTVSSKPEELTERIEPNSTILLHIDCDAFNNRYNGNSHWISSKSSIDFNISQIKKEIDRLFKLFSTVSGKVYLNIALSPAFFPSEYWKEVLNYIIVTGDSYEIIKDDQFASYLRKNHPKEIFNGFHS